MEDQIILERLKEAFQSIDGVSIKSETCPAPEKIWDAQKGVLGREEVHAVIDHMSGCGSCAQAWRVALEIGEPDEESEQAPTQAKVIRFPWLVPGAALAVAAVLIMAFVVQLQRSSTELPAQISYRDSTDETEIRSLLPKSQNLSKAGFTLAWEHTLSGNLTFDIQVQNENLEPIAQADRLQQTTFAVTEEMLKGLPANGRILWQVIVRVDGERVHWSPTFVNVVE